MFRPWNHWNLWPPTKLDLLVEEKAHNGILGSEKLKSKQVGHRFFGKIMEFTTIVQRVFSYSIYYEIVDMIDFIEKTLLKV